MRDEQRGRFPVGAVDINVHYGPDVVARSQTATQTLGWASELLLAGYCLRSHTGSTTDLANALNETSGAVSVVGALTLNAPVGGINPDAVDVALASGARLISLPTWDSGAEPVPPRHRSAPIEVVDDSGTVLPAVDEVFSMVARFDACLDIGTAPPTHVLPLVRCARSHGITRIVVSHPFYAAQKYSRDLQVEAAEAGAVIEHCYMQFDPGYAGRAEIAVLARHIREVGAERVALSSDSGKVGFPTMATALPKFHALLQHVFSDDEIALMLVTNPGRLLGLDPCEVVDTAPPALPAN